MFCLYSENGKCLGLFTKFKHAKKSILNTFPQAFVEYSGTEDNMRIEIDIYVFRIVKAIVFDFDIELSNQTLDNC